MGRTKKRNCVPAPTLQELIDDEPLGSQAQLRHIIKLLHQHGAVVINMAATEATATATAAAAAAAAAGDSASLVKRQRLIDAEKASFSSPETVVDDIFDSFRRDGTSISRLHDRLMKISPVLPVAQHSTLAVPALRAAASILNKISDLLGATENIFASDNERFSLTTILSKEESSVQHLHADFAPSAGSSSWRDYFRVSKELGMTPLSFLFFPEGGHLTYVAADLAVSERYIRSLAPDDANYTRRDRTYGNAPAGGSYRKSPAVTRTLQIKAGSFVLFRQDVAHQGMGYRLTNLRYFVYFDLKRLARLSDATTQVDLHERRKVNVEKMADAEAYIPPPAKRQNIRKY